ncbi:MAG: hypothetical protein AAGI17_02250 [Planctomycetota bacterium]
MKKSLRVGGEALARRVCGRSSRPLSIRATVGVALGGSALYGVALGWFETLSTGKALHVLITAVKSPLLLATTAALTLPAVGAVTLALRGRAVLVPFLRSLADSHAAAGLVLASLAPLVLVAYTAIERQREAILVNLLAFAVASIAGHVVLRRRLRERLGAFSGLRPILMLWFALYSFVGIQAGWMLRPFVLGPYEQPALLRERWATNGYLGLLRIIEADDHVD